MTMTVRFEIQIEEPNHRHGWRPLANPGGLPYFYLTEDARVQVRDIKTIHEARDAISRLRLHYRQEWLKLPKFRIVKSTHVVSYDVVE